VGRPPDVDIVYPEVMARASGYLDTDVDMGW
jgi:hypothetical protein